MGVQTHRGVEVNDPEWIRRHRAVWGLKPALSDWYRGEIFARLDAALLSGSVLHLGSGPGLYGVGRGEFVNADISASSRVDVVCDVHRLPFHSGSFRNVVGVDVLHHFARPGAALGEMARVLAPGGRCLLVEPWAGPMGWLVYRFFHHEDCRAVEQPWTEAFAGEKSPLDGNAWIPRALLWRKAAELGVHAPGLSVARVEPFGGLGYLATGGFGRIGVSARIVRALTAFDSKMPRWLAKIVALRAFFVLERNVGNST